MKRRAALALGSLAWVRVGAAAPAPPPEVLGIWPAVRLQGQARMTFLGLRIYDARLWLPAHDEALRRYEDTAFALALHYLRRLQGGAIAERSIVEMRRIGPFSDTQARAWLAAMQRAFPDVSDGDRLVGLHLPGRGARFFYNGEPTADIDDPEFARLFFGIWLSPHTSEPRLREQLLGLSGSQGAP